MKLWRPWFRIDNTRDILQGATDNEYKEILKDLILSSGVPPQETGKKKRIMLEKKTEKIRRNRIMVKVSGPGR